MDAIVRTEEKIARATEPGVGDPAPPWLPGRGLKVVLAAILLLWLGVTVPLALGWRTFFLRDVFSNHFVLKAFGAEQLAEGRIPAFNPVWALGQAFRGNPSATAFYPGNVLYLLLPFWSAYNLHFALHWLLALLTMWALARELGQSPAGALCAGLTYAGSGWMISSLTFYNLLATAAWWPLAMLGAARGGRAGIALGGLACGMALLAGEPVTATLGLLPMALVVIRRHGWRRGLATAFAVGLVGLALALPQVVATARVLGFTFRGGHGTTAYQASLYGLHPARLLELLVPFPFGWPAYVGRFGFWARDIAGTLPFFFSIYFGIVALWLAAAAARRRPAWALLAVAGLLLAWLGGLSGALLTTFSAGLFRFAEKFLFLTAVALPLLAGWGVEEVLARWRGWSRAALAAAAAAVLAALGLYFFFLPSLLAYLAQREADPASVYSYSAMARAQGQLWMAALLLAALLLVAAARAARSGRGALLVGLQLVALAQLAPIVFTDAADPYRRPSPWLRQVPAGGSVFHELLTIPSWIRTPSFEMPEGSKAIPQRLMAHDLHPAPGVLHGLTYPFLPDAEGMCSPLYTLVHFNLALMDWTQRARWFRAFGLDAAVLFEEPGVPELELVAEEEQLGVVSRLYRVRQPAPPAWWPEAVEGAESPVDALKRVSASEDPVARVVVASGLEHRPGGRARLVAESPDRIELEVESPGGVAVARRAYQPLFRARAEPLDATAGDAGPRRLETFPANLNLTGIAVPPGRWRVVLSVSHGPEIAAALFALFALFALLILGRPWRALRWPANRAPSR